MFGFSLSCLSLIQLGDQLEAQDVPDNYCIAELISPSMFWWTGDKLRDRFLDVSVWVPASGAVVVQLIVLVHCHTVTALKSVIYWTFTWGSDKYYWGLVHWLKITKNSEFTPFVMLYTVFLETHFEVDQLGVTIKFNSIEQRYWQKKGTPPI